MRDLFVDHTGKLWIANPSAGLLRLDDVNPEQLNFIHYTPVEGLSGIGVSYITEDEFGNFRPSAGEWWINRSSNGTTYAFQFGNSTDKPAQGDYTGDQKADIAIFRPGSGEWFVLRSENQSYYSIPFGTNGDIPSPGDFDGDGKFDATVFRSSNNTWFSQRISAGALIQSFGQAGDKSVPMLSFLKFTSYWRNW
jgi:hypothetical protein